MAVRQMQKKARPTDATWPLGQSLPRSDCESGAYFLYAGGGAATSLCWAQAPKVKALAKTVTIMIAFKILILFLTPFVAGCFRALCFILANANCATTGHGLPSCEAEAILPASWSALLNGQDVRLPQQPRWLCDRCKKRPGRRMRPGL